MKILFTCGAVLFINLLILRATVPVFKWAVAPARIHVLALVSWITAFAVAQAMTSIILPAGSVSPYEIGFVLLIATLFYFLVVRVLYQENWKSSAIVACTQGLVVLGAGYLIAG